VIVATDNDQVLRLDELQRRGRENGVESLQRLDQAGLKDLEPHVQGIAALYVPGTAIVSYRQVAETYAQVIRVLGGEISF
jgi:L-2-hydroxyglutarate oxidase